MAGRDHRCMPDLFKVKTLTEATELLSSRVVEMNANMGEMNQAIKTMAVKMDEMTTAVQSAIIDMAASVREMTDRMSNSLENAVHSMGEMNIKMNLISGLRESLKDTLPTSTLEKTIDRIQELLPDFLRTKKKE